MENKKKEKKLKLMCLFIAFASIAAIGFGVARWLPVYLQAKEASSSLSEAISDGSMLISLEDDFFDHTCKFLILRAGYGFPDKFALQAVENDPGKEAAYEKGIAWCEKEARNGSDTDQQCLMHYYDSIYKDSKRALYWANKQAEQGSDRGMMILCRAYQSGDGVMQDRSEAMKWMFLARVAGSPEAKKIMRELGKMPQFEETSYVKIGREKAKYWMQEHPHVFFNPDDGCVGNS